MIPALLGMASPTRTGFVMALAAFVLAAGLSIPLTVLVGRNYAKDDPKREGGYTLYYLAINFGGFIAPFICAAWIGAHYGYRWGFVAAAAGMLTGCRATQFAGLEHALGARFDHFAAGAKHPRLDLFTGEGAEDEPGFAFEKRDAATVIGQALDAQALLFTGRNLRGLAATRGLEAQASLVLGHQLGASKMPVDR